MSKGRVYRRCSCRGEDGRQLGARCPLLISNRKHGTWSFAVDVPSVDGRRRTLRRGGYPTKGAAARAKDGVLDRCGAGVKVDDREKTAGYLTGWLEDQRQIGRAACRER